MTGTGGLRRSVLANLAGRGWSALAQLLATPLYVEFVGIGGFGLIGFFLTLVALSNLLDFGLSATLNRALARTSADPGAHGGAGDLVRSIEVVYVMIAVIITAGMVALAGPIAVGWLGDGGRSAQDLTSAVMAMGVALGAYWPLSLYAGGLLGLQRHVLLNAATALLISVRVGGSLVVLAFVSPTVIAFFLWQAVAGLLHAGVLRWLLVRSLPESDRSGRFRWSAVRGVSKFAWGVAGISMLALVFTQGDKLLLSRILTLEAFGYYSLAALAASGLSYLILPVFETVFPRLAALVAAARWDDVATVYHRASQTVSMLVVPTAVVLAVFSPAVLWAWTGSRSVVTEVSTVLSLLAVGTALNALMNVPYALMLADGWTGLPFLLNLGAVLVLGPALLILASRHGGIGAAWVWIALNASYVAVGTFVLHRRLLRGRYLAWLGTDVAAPAGAVVVVVALIRVTVPLPDSRLFAAGLSAGALCAAIGVAAFSTPFGRALYARAMLWAKRVLVLASGR